MMLNETEGRIVYSRHVEWSPSRLPPSALHPDPRRCICPQSQSAPHRRPNCPGAAIDDVTRQPLGGARVGSLIEPKLAGPGTRWPGPDSKKLRRPADKHDYKTHMRRSHIPRIFFLFCSVSPLARRAPLQFTFYTS